MPSAVPSSQAQAQPAPGSEPHQAQPQAHDRAPEREDQGEGDEEKSAFTALKAVKSTQEKRVAFWAEYEDALGAHLAVPLSEGGESGRGEREGAGARDPDGEGQELANGSVSGHGHDHGHGHSHGHYDPPPRGLDDVVMVEVLRLVTQGLLDCSHTLRTLETELRTTLARPDLARLAGQIQDGENELLRTTVRRDQLRKVARLEERDAEEEVRALDGEVKRLRESIGELMQEVNAEMAEM